MESSFRLELVNRPRRNRKNQAIRNLVRETTLSPDKFIYPLFIQEGTSDEPIASMPGASRLCLKGLIKEVRRAASLGVNAVVLFPAIDDALKTAKAEEAYNDDGLVPRAIRAIKEENPDMIVVTDVALDPYSSDGHDGLVSPDGRILNDETVEILCKQALSQARAGVDIIAPSDMMDGRIGALREALDGDGFTEVSLLSYTAKYASAYYGPFRGALDSNPRHGDKKTYQMDPANVREAIFEAMLDIEEGADMLMVKPAGPYLDVLSAVRENTSLPLAAYQVSGEYLMIKSAAAAGWLDEDKVILESLTGIRRAGADMILTYFACDAAKLLQDN
jgi:porphobilinogen synthase